MPPKKKKPQPGSRRRRGNTASPPEPGGGGSLRERLGIGVQPRQLQHASEVAARLSPRAARAELAEMEAMLSRHGYPSRYAANLRSDGMGPLELEHRLRTPPGNEASLVYTHERFQKSPAFETYEDAFSYEFPEPVGAYPKPRARKRK